MLPPLTKVSPHEYYPPPHQSVALLGSARGSEVLCLLWPSLWFVFLSFTMQVVDAGVLATASFTVFLKMKYLSTQSAQNNRVKFRSSPNNGLHSLFSWFELCPGQNPGSAPEEGSVRYCCETCGVQCPQCNPQCRSLTS